MRSITLQAAKNTPEHPAAVMEDVQLPGSNRDISVWIDCYDDIFSDFDLREYTIRNVSDDFLREIKKVSHECDPEVVTLNLFIPEHAREKKTESIIAKRLHAHFTKNHAYFFKRKKLEGRKNLLMIVVGISMMTGAGFIATGDSGKFIPHLLKAVLEPGGWFLVWVGMENAINSSRKEKPELNFYRKMQKSMIMFLNK